MKLFEFVSAECFDKIINHLFIRENIFKIHIVIDNLILYLMMLNINVFDSFIMLKIFNENDNILIVAENHNRLK